MKKEQLAFFRGSQDDLYTVGTRGWNLYNDHQADFQKFNGMYTKEWGQQNLAAIEAAKKLPDVSVRRATPKELRKKLKPYADVCLAVSLTLFSGIEKVFDESEWETEKQKAGADNYTAARKYKWRKVSALMTAGAEYLAENFEILQNGGKGLPATFQNTYTEAQTAFDNGYSMFGSSKNSFTDQTTEKGEANNSIHRNLQRMLDDGKIINRNNIRLRRQFAYANILKSITGAGKTGFHILVFDPVTTLPIDNASISFLQSTKTEAANAKGVIEVTLPAGTYDFTITAPGRKPLEGTLTATTGTMHREKFALALAELNNQAS